VALTLGTKTGNTQAACVSAGLVKYGWRVRVSGVQSHIWILRNFAEWTWATADEVRECVENGALVADASAFA
jgi:hypothetical protein